MRRPTSFHATLAAVAALVAVVATMIGVAPAQTPGAISIRLADAPSDRQNDPRARIYVVDHLHQGDRIVRHIEVGNGTDQPVAVELYAAAASLKDGQFVFGDGRARNELSSWTTVDPGVVQAPAHGTARTTVTVTVPRTAVDGERYAVIWAQPPASGGNVPVVSRVGVRMYVSVGEGAEPVTDFRIDTLVAARDAQGRPVVRTSVTNTGERAIDLSGSLSLTDGPGSLKTGPFPMRLGTTLAPKESAPATVQLDKNLPNGPWKATVTVIADGEATHKAQATITFPSTAASSSKPVVAESVKRQRRILIPVAVVLVAAVLGGIAASAEQRRKRRLAVRTT